jgi:hypothetical protein
MVCIPNSSTGTSPWAQPFPGGPRAQMPYLMLQSRYDTWQTGNELGSKDVSNPPRD